MRLFNRQIYLNSSNSTTKITLTFHTTYTCLALYVHFIAPFVTNSHNGIVLVLFACKILWAQGDSLSVKFTTFILCNENVKEEWEQQKQLKYTAKATNAKHWYYYNSRWISVFLNLQLSHTHTHTLVLCIRLHFIRINDGQNCLLLQI